MPILQEPHNVKGNFTFMKPMAVNMIGSIPLGLSCRPDVQVDVVVELPKVNL